jgi:2-hydroxychromene-2-carboxylate isomerase
MKVSDDQQSVYRCCMQFAGQVWFDFSTPSVWVFYQWLRLLAESGAAVGIEWMPLPKGTERAAMSTLVSLEDPTERSQYLHAMLGLVHIEGMPATDLKTVAAALDAAGLDREIVTDAHPLLEDLKATATGLGVDAVPTLYRTGPVISIQLNPAVLNDDPMETAQKIIEIMESDGIWELRKP